MARPDRRRVGAAATAALADQGRGPARADERWTGLEIDGARLMLTDGRPARRWRRTTGCREVALVRPAGGLPVAPALRLAGAGEGSPAWRAQGRVWLAALVSRRCRWPDVLAWWWLCTLAMLINEAADVEQGVARPRA